MAENRKRPSSLVALAHALRSWRTASVALLSFSSGLPLGLVWIAIPDWMRKSGMDIRVVGLFTLAQAPWSFKFLWSPLMDRYAPPWLGRRRGWMAIAQVALLALTLALAGLGNNPDSAWVLGALALAIACASATQDIAIDAYTVDVLHEEEQGIAAGARTVLGALWPVPVDETTPVKTVLEETFAQGTDFLEPRFLVPNPERYARRLVHRARARIVHDLR